MYQQVYVNPELLDQIGKYILLVRRKRIFHYKDNAGINEKKVNSESPIIECGISCNLNDSCNGFFFRREYLQHISGNPKDSKQ